MEQERTFQVERLTGIMCLPGIPSYRTLGPNCWGDSGQKAFSGVFSGSAVAAEVPESQTWFLSFPYQWLWRQEVLTEPPESALGNPEKPFSLQSSFGVDKAAIRIDQHHNSTTGPELPGQGTRAKPVVLYHIPPHHTPVTLRILS